MAGTFRDLHIWKKAYELLMEIYEITQQYPSDEKYNLTSQTRRSANGVLASIAEAHGRFYFADKIRVLYISRGECEETQSHLSVALGCKYISEEEFMRLDSEYFGLSKGINAYILSLREDKKKT